MNISQEAFHLKLVKMIVINYWKGFGTCCWETVTSVAAGGVRPTSVLRAEALQKRKCDGRGRAEDQSGQKGRTGGPRGGGAHRLGGWHPPDTSQPESCVHVLAGGRLQATATELLSPRHVGQRSSWQNCNCSTVCIPTIFLAKAAFVFASSGGSLLPEKWVDGFCIRYGFIKGNRNRMTGSVGCQLNASYKYLKG